MKDVICRQCGCINEYYTEQKANNLVAYCNHCKSFIKNIPHAKPALHFGKYKGTLVEEVQDGQYLNWVLANIKLTESYRTAIANRLNYLNNL